MNTIYALFICIGAITCQYADGPFLTLSACEAHRDAYFKSGDQYRYVCMKKTVAPGWESAD